MLLLSMSIVPDAFKHDFLVSPYTSYVHIIHVLHFWEEKTTLSVA